MVADTNVPAVRPRWAAFGCERAHSLRTAARLLHTINLSIPDWTSSPLTSPSAISTLERRAPRGARDLIGCSSPDFAIPVFFGLAYFGLLGADEPRYAQVAREMLARHDWITPTLGGKPWLEKPALYYWQAMLAYSVFGVSDWAARLPSAVDATMMVVAVYLFLRRFRSGFQLDGALIAASASGVIGFARAASTDMPLAAISASPCWPGMHGTKVQASPTWRCHYVFLGLAMLAKGPVAPFLAAWPLS